MKLFFVPAGCSLSVHIALAATGLPYELVSINREKRTADGRDFLGVNPMGFVPALEFDDGTVLGEALANLVYIAERTGALLAPGGPERWRVLEATSFMATEIHGNFKPFWKGAGEAEKDNARRLLVRQFALLAGQLGDRRFLVGDAMTIADTYLFVMLMWASRHGIEVPERFAVYSAGMREVPAVKRALVEEGVA